MRSFLGMVLSNVMTAVALSALTPPPVIRNWPLLPPRVRVPRLTTVPAV